MCNSSSIPSENLNTKECGWDGGDCIIPGYPDCHVALPLNLFGNSICTAEYNTIECGWNGGDCVVDGFPNCRTDDPTLIGDSNCVLVYNTTDCGFDGGDCLIPYPFCNVVDTNKLRNEVCDSSSIPSENYNTEECGWDGGDCLVDGFPDCRTDNPTLIGDSNCVLVYNTTDCGFDGGDCSSQVEAVIAVVVVVAVVAVVVIAGP